MTSRQLDDLAAEAKAIEGRAAGYKLAGEKALASTASAVALRLWLAIEGLGMLAEAEKNERNH